MLVPNKFSSNPAILHCPNYPRALWKPTPVTLSRPIIYIPEDWTFSLSLWETGLDLSRFR